MRVRCKDQPWMRQKKTDDQSQLFAFITAFYGTPNANPCSPLVYEASPPKIMVSHTWIRKKWYIHQVSMMPLGQGGGIICQGDPLWKKNPVLACWVGKKWPCCAAAWRSFLIRADFMLLIPNWGGVLKVPSLTVNKKSYPLKTALSLAS